MSLPSKSPKRPASKSFAKGMVQTKRRKSLSVGQASTLREGSAGSEPSGSSESENQTERISVDELPFVWDQQTLDFRNRAEEALQAQPNAVRIAQLMSEYRLGGAYVRAFGHGHVRGVVNMSEDPNARGNLRPLEREHVIRLYRVFATPGAKCDHPSPIFLAMDSSTIDPDCLERMKACDARDPSAELPLLRLNHDTATRQLELETWIHSERREGRWLSAAELGQLKEELESLRSDNLRALLLNGAHRLSALEMVGDELMNRQRDLVRRIKAEDITVEELRQKREELEEDSLLANYRVEVYEAKNLPDELVNWLVRNEESRPAKGMGVGEKTWWTGERFLIWMEQARLEGERSRAAQLEYAFKMWCKEVAPSRFIRGSSLKLMPEQARTAHLKAEWAGDDPVSRLFSEPFTLEMVLDTRHAVQVYSSVIGHKLSVAMLQPAGTLLACRFWLSTRILMEIFNVHGAEDLNEAEEFIDETPLDSLGASEAVHHWHRMHIRPQKVPSLLDSFDNAAMERFDGLYNPVWELSHPTRGVQWDEEDVILTVREAFDGLGEWYGTQPMPGAKAISISFRVYARLPLGSSDDPGPSFYPAGGLPTPDLLRKQLKAVDDSNYSPALVVLDYLLDEYSPTWTIGSQPNGAAVNANGWYLRPRGLHQIAMRMIKGTSAGSLSDKLHSAILLLSDTRIGFALNEISHYFARELDELETRCNVVRSQNINFEVLNDYPAEVLEAHGGYDALFKKLKAARTFLRTKGVKEEITEELVDELYSKHPFLFELIDKDFWMDVGATEWLSGWNTQEARRFRNLNSLFGWGMYCKRIQPIVEAALWHRTVPHLLQVCLTVAETQGGKPWWSGVFSYDETREAPSPVPTDYTLSGQEAGLSPHGDSLPPDPRSPTPSDTNSAEAERSPAHRFSSRSPSHTPSEETYVDSNASPERDKTPTATAYDPDVPDISLEYADTSVEMTRDDVTEREGSVAWPPLPAPSSRGSSAEQDHSFSAPLRPLFRPVSESPFEGRSATPASIHARGGSHPSVGLATPGNVTPTRHHSAGVSGSAHEAGGPIPAIFNLPQVDDWTLFGSPNSLLRRPAATPGAESVVAVDDSTHTPRASTSAAKDFGHSRQDSTEVPHMDNVPALFPPITAEEKGKQRSQDSLQGPTHVYTQLPPHIFTPPVASPRILESVLCAAATPSFPTRIDEVSMGYDRYAGINRAIVMQRQALRESVMLAARMCLVSPYGGTFAVTGLPSMIASLKDDFACRVARIFSSQLKLSAPEAMTESMRICQADGLFEHDLVIVDLESGKLLLDFRYTFPKARQAQVADHSIFDVGPVPGSKDERVCAVSYGRYLHAPRGPGMTEKESAIRGRDSARLLECKLHGRKAEPQYVPVIGDYPDPASQPPERSLNDSLEQGSALESLRQWKVEPRVVPAGSNQPSDQESPYSTGNFLPAAFVEALFMGVTSPDKLALGAEAADDCERAWVEAQGNDFRAYESRFRFGMPHAENPGWVGSNYLSTSLDLRTPGGVSTDLWPNPEGVSEAENE